MGTELSSTEMQNLLAQILRINGSTKKYTNLNLIEIVILGLILAILAG